MRLFQRYYLHILNHPRVGFWTWPWTGIPVTGHSHHPNPFEEVLPSFPYLEHNNNNSWVEPEPMYLVISNDSHSNGGCIVHFLF